MEATLSRHTLKGSLALRVQGVSRYAHERIMLSMRCGVLHT